MIEVTRLNGALMLVNSDLIKIVESSPDTMLTLIHGEKLIVRETCGEVLEKILVYRAKLLATVTDRISKQPELIRIVGATSLNPESGVPSIHAASGAGSGSGSQTNAIQGGVRGRITSGLKIERSGR